MAYVKAFLIGGAICARRTNFNGQNKANAGADYGAARLFGCGTRCARTVRTFY